MGAPSQSNLLRSDGLLDRARRPKLTRTSMLRTPSTILAACACVVAPGNPLANAQSTPATTVAPAKAATTPPATDLGGYRLPLLREGSVVSRLVGDLMQDPDEKVWIFRPIEPEPGGLRREFLLLPSPVLEDLVRTARVAGAPVQFEMTGRVFIYRGRNFLLPDFAPTVMRFDTKPGDTPKPDAATQPTPNGEDKFVAPKAGADAKSPDAKDDQTVRDIERRLEERVGRAPQSRTGDAHAQASSHAAKESAPIASGTRLSLRAGRLSRDPQAGSWRFVPEQATGSGDPSIEILPCLLLEKLENAARENDVAPEILISGTVYAYEGRSYLLPSSFRRMREGRGLGG